MIKISATKNFTMKGVRLANERLYCECCLCVADGDIDKSVQMDLAEWPDIAAAVVGPTASPLKIPLREAVENAAAFVAGLISEKQLLTTYSPPAVVEE